MNATRLQQLIEAYGGNPQRWPPDEREAAAALLSTDGTSRAMLAQASEIDRGLDAVFGEHELQPLQARVLALASAEAVTRQTPPVRRRGFLSQLWQELGGFRLVAPTFATALSLAIVLSNWFDPQAADVPAIDNDLASLTLLATDDEDLLP
ncbi:MAG: hypothetical protein KDI37_11740 [Xanthomonadales bacterium]|nr:hypothetical protein [Xanthomonadales bacterium]MCB1634126.1 hypothetical protein [Xanthomonadales bacterium]MCB1642397.1 hypothetical protein [Xanthomonadales bacterium]